MLDANIILRYLLYDNKELADAAEQIIKDDSAFVTIEVLAEVVYVLNGLYDMERQKIRDILTDFMELVTVEQLAVVKTALDAYADYNLDFVDCVLYGYHKVKGFSIKTFDKKLKRLIENG